MQVGRNAAAGTRLMTKRVVCSRGDLRSCRVSPVFEAAVILFAAVTAVLAGATTAFAGSHDQVLVRSVSSYPPGHALSPTRLNVVVVHPGLRFTVELENKSRLKRDVRVALRTAGAKGSKPGVQRQSVPLAPAQLVSLQFKKLGQVAFAQRQTLKITVTDAAHREVWSRSFRVIFALG
jgi:hypothetical protein